MISTQTVTEMLSEGAIAPDFELEDQDSKTHRLSDYIGKKVVLYFYPRDNTPGCTVEACNFRDDESAYKKKGAVILGVSTDDVSSHKKFSTGKRLPFTLLADTEKKVVNLYGVWKEKSFLGKKFLGTSRETFIIDEKGKIMKHFDDVSVRNHSKEILELL
jgi:peroxiredoxin Q/BCP